MLRSSSRRIVWFLAVVGLAGAMATSQAAAVAPTPPHIVAKPNNLMINTKTTLTGSGFPAKARLMIEECSSTGWVVVANPCVKTNKISVVTDRQGRFKAQFLIVLCGGKRGPEPTSQICYLGNPQPEGIDTITLLGAAKVTVTYP
jgi:hypothetical protein